VDCIQLGPAEGLTEGLEGWHFPLSVQDRADALRDRYDLFKRRIEGKVTNEAVPKDDGATLKAHHQAEIAAALARERTRRGKAP
jgi:hypothetical protein